MKCARVFRSTRSGLARLDSTNSASKVEEMNRAHGGRQCGGCSPGVCTRYGVPGQLIGHPHAKEAGNEQLIYPSITWTGSFCQAQPILSPESNTRGEPFSAPNEGPLLSQVEPAASVTDFENSKTSPDSSGDITSTPLWLCTINPRLDMGSRERSYV